MICHDMEPCVSHVSYAAESHKHTTYWCTSGSSSWMVFIMSFVGHECMNGCVLCHRDCTAEEEVVT